MDHKRLNHKQQMSVLIAQNSDAILVVDTSGVIRFANPAVKKIFGRGPGELTGEAFGFPIGDQEATTIQILGEGKRARTAELRIVEIEWDGEPAYLAAIRDITDRVEAETRLRESERKYRLLFETSTDAVCISSRDGRFLDFNRAACRLFGYDREQMQAFRTSALYEDPEDRVDFQIVLETKGSVRNYPVVLKKNDGSLLDCLLTASLVKQEQGGVAGYQEVIRDVTEQLEVEESLALERFKLKKFFENLPLPAYRFDLDGRMIDCNMAAVDLLKAENKEALVGKSFANAGYAPVSREKAERLFAALSKEKKIVDEELRILDSRGREREVLVNCDTIAGHRGEPLFFVVTQIDITRRKRAERAAISAAGELEEMVAQRTRQLHEALAETEASRDRIGAILKSVADGLIVTDTCNRIVMMNRAAEKMLQVRSEEVAGGLLDSAIRDEKLRQRIRETLEMRKSGSQFEFEIPGKNPLRPRIMRAKTSMIEDRKNEHAGTVTIFYDVTRERKIAQMKNEFISTAAHELRAPLTSIQGFAEILLTRKKLSARESGKFLQYIGNQSSSLSRIVDELLDLSRIESGAGFAVERTENDIRPMIRQVVARHAENTTMHRFETVLSGDARPFLFDSGKIEQVLDNIVGNAVKYSPDGGLIRVDVVFEGSRCAVSVSDEGIGMTQHDAERIFDKFYRADASNTAVSGTGLGMSIVKNIIEAHGGRISVESAAGKGTRIWFTLPIEPSLESELSGRCCDNAIKENKGVSA